MAPLDRLWLDFYSIWSVSLNLFLRLWYFMVIGMALGALVTSFAPIGRLASAVEGRGGFRPVVLATFLGALSPLGSYAVIPIFSALLSSGIPKATVMAFLITSPLINPFMFVATWGILGPGMALARLISALALGLLCGALFHTLEAKGVFARGAEGGAKPNPIIPKAMSASSGKRGWRGFFTLFVGMLRYPGKYFLLAIILAGVVDNYIPQSKVVMLLGAQHSYSILLATAMGIPFYICGGGALPLVFQLMRMGMENGAALAFFIAGPTTRIAPMITVLLLVRGRAFLLYFCLAIVGGITCGLIYNQL